jgi:GGDEF domain-containing protein
MAESDSGERRPRPVADMPPGPLADGTRAAKAWLLALLEAAPLAAAGELPAAALAREGPALCAGVLRALGSERELERLGAGGDLAAAAGAAGRLAGAEAPAAVAAAVGRLRQALWEALVLELPRLDAATTAALAARLGHVCDAVLQAALADGPAAEPWPDALGRLVAAAHAAHGPLALLALEADDAERLLAADPEGAAQALARVEGAVRAAVPATATVLGERPGRLWVVAPGCGPGDARALGERLVDATADVAAHRGASLTVAIGVAACPEDATDAPGLMARADEGVFAARAAGVRLA